MKYKNPKKGETLIEVIAALTSIVLAGIAAVTVVLSVMTTTAISKEYLVAQNLAREGVEGVANYRNTNWLKFPAHKTNCWMTYEQEEPDCILSPANVVKTDRSYLLKRADNGRLYLEETASELNLKGDGTDEDAFIDYKLHVTADNRYVHDIPGDLKEPEPHPDFYRMIRFKKVAVGDSDQTFREEQMKIVVTVQWLNKSTPKTYELSTVITNHDK